MPLNAKPAPALRRGLGAACALLFYMPLSAAAMEPLDEQALSAVDAGSLFAAAYTPVGAGNPNTAIDFYRIMLDAEIDMNVNIRKLALGCGGVNGTAGCDLDIDNLSLTGMASSAADAGPPTDFVLYRPYLEFAIKNSGSLANRSVAGVRVGGIESFGMMGVGERPAGVDNNPAHHTGINSLSGDMLAEVSNAQLPVVLCTLFGFGAANASRTACSTGVAIPAGNATINTDVPNAGDNRFQVVLQRKSSTVLSPVVAIALGLLSLKADFTEDLRFVHSLQLGADTNGNGRFDPGEGTKDFYLSLQNQAVVWPKVSTGNFTGAIAAQRGWWMSIPKAILGNFTARSVYAGDGEAIGALLGGANVAIPNVDLNQKAVDNCWGALTFC